MHAECVDEGQHAVPRRAEKVRNMAEVNMADKERFGGCDQKGNELGKKAMTKERQSTAEAQNRCCEPEQTDSANGKCSGRNEILRRVSPGPNAKSIQYLDERWVEVEGVASRKTIMVIEGPSRTSETVATR